MTFLIAPIRDIPVIISAVDSPEKIAEADAAIEPMLQDGLTLAPTSKWTADCVT